MKKLSVFILALVLCFSICACGSESESANDVKSSVTEENTKSNNDKIEFDNVVLLDDENITIKLDSFFTKDQKTDGVMYNEKGLALEMTNKTEEEIIMFAYFYLDNEQLKDVMFNGTNTIESMKSAQIGYYIEYNDMIETKPLDSIDQLYELDGKFEIHVGNDTYETDFSIKEATK